MTLWALVAFVVFNTAPVGAVRPFPTQESCEAFKSALIGQLIKDEVKLADVKCVQINLGDPT